jgi:hypothetical protein
MDSGLGRPVRIRAIAATSISAAGRAFCQAGAGAHTFFDISVFPKNKISFWACI